MYIIVYFILVFRICMVSGDKSALCSLWNGIEQNLKNQLFHFTCSEDSDCHGLNCSGTVLGCHVNSRLQLYACENPPSIEFEVNIPKLKVNHLKQRIYHNDTISLASYLNIEFEMQRTKQELVLAIFLHLDNDSSWHGPSRLPIVSHVRFPLDCPSVIANRSLHVDSNEGISSVSLPTSGSFVALSKGLDQGYINCSITNSTCGEEEICRQLNKEKPDGRCVCISDYKRNEDGECTYDPTAHASTETPGGNPDNHKREGSNVSLLLTAILVPISVILLIVGLVYASIRFRVFQHLRRRLRVQVYEHVLLGEDDEEDLTNPVA